MEFIDAPELDWRSLTEEARNSVLEQLGRHLEELRTIEPPAGTHIEALNKGGTADVLECSKLISCLGSLLDPRRGSTPFGPFKSFESFARYFGYIILSNSEEPSVKENLARFFARQQAFWLGKAQNQGQAFLVGIQCATPDARRRVE